MNSFIKHLFSSILIIFLLSCERSRNQTSQIDDNSYINDFELIQKNIRNDSIIKISSPKAIINQTSNDFQIFDSSIELSNKTGNVLQIDSGRSTLNNSQNVLRIFNKVNVTLKNNQNTFIKTDTLDWDLGRSLISISTPLEVNLPNTKILSESGYYNIDKNQLIINNNFLKRSIFNINGIKKYQIEIISDIATWSTKNNLLEFKSIDKQVESSIDFLSTE
tara:strand:+ start:535 stop:1194 length:660 start_codon:yes stop_codon:yes gene_type:complete